ncbi:MAG: glutamine amidotransferase [Pseudomonadota bacterium]
MKRVLVLRHLAFEDLGRLQAILERARFSIRYFEVGVDSFFDVSPLDVDLVIVLGGPISAYDGDQYPFLKEEIAWLRARLLEDLPTLGICLGAQLMAAALHARVYPGQAKEIGWAPLALGAHSDTVPAIERFILGATPVLHWHGDTFDLPPGARHLAATDGYRNQAFAWGQHCLALQFHPEFDARKLEQWLIGHGLEIASTPGLTLERLRADTARYGAQAQLAAETMLRDWLGSVVRIPVTALLPRNAHVHSAA